MRMKPASTTRSGAKPSITRASSSSNASRLGCWVWSTSAVVMPCCAANSKAAAPVGDDRHHLRRPAFGGTALHDGLGIAAAAGDQDDDALHDRPAVYVPGLERPEGGPTRRPPPGGRESTPL